MYPLTRKYDLRFQSRVNYFSSASALPSRAADIPTALPLAALARCRLEHLLAHPILQHDAQGQVDELKTLVSVTGADTKAETDINIKPYLAGIISPESAFPAIDELAIEGERSRLAIEDPKGASVWRKALYKAYFTARRQHAHRLNKHARADTVDVAPSAATVCHASSTGWSGTSTGYSAHLDVNRLRQSGCKFLPCEPSRPLRLVSNDGYVLAVRSHALDSSATSSLNSFITRWHDPLKMKKLASKPGERGDHRLTLLGTTRGYKKDLHFTALHKTAPVLAEEMMRDPDLLNLSLLVSRMLMTYFPLVYERFQAADPANEDPNHRHRCRFGVFPLFCLNYANGKSVECRPHCDCDWKNVAGGICAVMAYGNFDSTKKSWLVFTDLNVAIELPHGHVALYPSSLLQHGNVDLVEADSEEAALAGEGIARGSLVWFAQANYIASRELAMTLDEAKKQGIARTYEDLYKVFVV